MNFVLKIFFTLFIMFVILLGITSMCMSSSVLLSIALSDFITLSFIGMMYNFKSKQKPQIMMSYFIVQSLTSLGFFLFLSTNFLFMAILSLMTKLGLAPGHIWAIDINKKINWKMWFILNSIMKIPSICLILPILNVYMSVMYMIVNSIFSIFSSLYIFNFQLMMFFSSMFNLSWILTMSFFLKNTVFIFIIYCLIILILIVPINMMNLNLLNFNKMKMSRISAIIISLVFITLAGFPPFAGFWYKIFVLNIMQSSNLLMFLFITFSFAWAYIYLSPLFSFMSFFKPYSNFFYNLKINFFYTLVIFAQLFVGSYIMLITIYNLLYNSFEICLSDFFNL